MKKIEAAIRPHKLAEVVEALVDIGIGGLTVREVLGTREGQEPSEFSWKNSDSFMPTLWLEIVVVDEIANLVVTTITKVARTGRRGDGKVFVSPILEVVSIRTGKRGREAIQSSNIQRFLE